MPQPLRQIPAPNDNSLVDNSTLEQIWGKLRKQYKVSSDLVMDFLTWIAPQGMQPKRGIWKPTPEAACFLVITPRDNDAPVRTFGMTPLAEYYTALKEAGHLVGRPHPAESIFAHLVPQHLRALGALKGLTDMDLAAYEENLRQANWVLEKAQGDRYEPLD